MVSSQSSGKKWGTGAKPPVGVAGVSPDYFLLFPLRNSCGSCQLCARRRDGGKLSRATNRLKKQEANRHLNTLFFIRHGENKANITKEFSYRTVDYPLTAKGILQAQQTAEYFADAELDEIYSSPLLRARQTAEIFAQPHSLLVTLVEEFRDLNVGDLEGQPPTAQSWDIFKQVLDSWLTGNPAAAFPGGENYFQLIARLQAGLVRVVAGKEGKSIAIVAHGSTPIFTLAALVPSIGLDILLRVETPNCSISVIDVGLIAGKLEAELREWASWDHLSGEAADLVSATPLNDAPPNEVED